MFPTPAKRPTSVVHCTLFIWYPSELSSYQGLVSVQLSCFLSMNRTYISYLLSFLKHKEGSWHCVSTSKLIYEDSCLLGCEWLLMSWKLWVLHLDVFQSSSKRSSQWKRHGSRVVQCTAPPALAPLLELHNPWRWRQSDSLKHHKSLTGWHSVTSQKAVMLCGTTVRNSQLTT